MRGIGYEAFQKMVTEAIQVSNEAKEKNDSKNIGAEIGRVREFTEEQGIPKERADKIVEDTIDELKEQASTEDRDLTAPNEQGHANDPRAPSKVMSTPGSMLMSYLDDTVQFNTDVPNDYQEGELRTLDDGTQVKVIGVTTTPVVEVVAPAPGAAPADALAATPEGDAVEEPTLMEEPPVDEPPVEEPPVDDLPPEEPIADTPPTEEEIDAEAAAAEAEVATEVDDKSVEQAAKEPPLDEEDDDDEADTTPALDISEDN